MLPSDDKDEGARQRHVSSAEKTAAAHTSDLILQTEDALKPDQDKNVQETTNETTNEVVPRASHNLPRLTEARSGESSKSSRSLASLAAEVATFHDVFGLLGIPTVAILVLSAGWTFALVVIQVHADAMANRMMKTTELDNGDFWLLPHRDKALVGSSAVLLSIFGIGYTGVAVWMLCFYRAGARTTIAASNSAEHGLTPFNVLQIFGAWIREKCGVSSAIRQYYFTAMLDVPKLIFQSITLFTHLREGFSPTLIYYYAVLLLCNWLIACYRCLRRVADPDLLVARLCCIFDMFFAVFEPLVVLLYFTDNFHFDHAGFMTKLETIRPGTLDTVARVFSDPVETSSFRNAIHYVRFSSGEALFFKSALHAFVLYNWCQITPTLIQNRPERKGKDSMMPDTDKPHQSFSMTDIISRKTDAEVTSKPNVGRHAVAKFFISIIFAAAGIGIFVYSIGSVRSSANLCSRYYRCAVVSYQWNFGHDRCTCLAFIDRQTVPKMYAEWINPVDTTENLAELATAEELRIVQIINRAVPELPEQLRGCHHLQQLILMYTKTEKLPEWLSEFSDLQYLYVSCFNPSPEVNAMLTMMNTWLYVLINASHIEGDFTTRRLQMAPAGSFENMPNLMFLHMGVIPDVEELPSLSGLRNLRYLTLAIASSLGEIPSFDGLSMLTSLNIVHAPRPAALPSLAPLASLTSLVIQPRSAVCCSGYVRGVCDLTETQCLPLAGEKYPLSCTDKRASVEDMAVFTSFGDAICPDSQPVDPEATAPSNYSTDQLCSGVKYKECSLNGVQGICYNTRMMIINCATNSKYIEMRKLQILRGVGEPCDPSVETWLGCR